MVRKPSLTGVTVLLVDDDPDELALVGTLLRTAGAAVTAVAKVEDALRALQNVPPRVVVSDLMIPGHDGFTLIRRIRRMADDGGGPHLPALAISGFDNADQRRYALEEGFDEYLPKPVHEHIVTTVARMVFPRRRKGEIHG
ncbi:MAG TPA: response regulator [Vicinamibacteria bacterium]|nr:response regulator [Vicinamibacteria bacterium]